MNIEELFDNEKWAGYGLVVTDDANLAIDYLKEEVMEYVAGLQKELAEEARLNGMGAEREAKLLARINELEAEIKVLRTPSKELKEIVRAATEKFLTGLKEKSLVDEVSEAVAARENTFREQALELVEIVKKQSGGEA